MQKKLRSDIFGDEEKKGSSIHLEFDPTPEKKEAEKIAIANPLIEKKLEKIEQILNQFYLKQTQFNFKVSEELKNHKIENLKTSDLIQKHRDVLHQYEKRTQELLLVIEQKEFQILSLHEQIQEIKRELFKYKKL